MMPLVPSSSRSPAKLRKMADHCRYLASTCVTDQAREPLNETAEELEREAQIGEELRQKFFGPGCC
jgi:hypothetical protein